EILRAISGSQTTAQSVFEAIAESAMRLLGAWSVAVISYDGKLLHLQAARGATPGTEQFLREHYPAVPNPDWSTGVCALERRPVQIADCWNAPSASLRERSRVRGYRSVLSVPMLREDEVIGVISVSRKKAGAFSPEEDDLLK